MTDVWMVHVPKTAGLAIKTAFRERGVVFKTKGHAFSDDLPTSGFKFAFVRDPYTRFKSAYYFARDYRKIRDACGQTRARRVGEDQAVAGRRHQHVRVQPREPNR